MFLVLRFMARDDELSLKYNLITINKVFALQQEVTDRYFT